MDCTHRPPCPGCPRLGQPGIAPAAREALRELAHVHGLPEPAVITGPASGFRHRARLAIRGRTGAPRIGMFELGTHRVVHIPNCLVHHPLINEVASIVRRALAQKRLSSYSESSHQGLARYLQIVIERRSGSAQVVLVGNSLESEPFAECLDLIRDRCGALLHSLWFNSNTGTGNAILGPDFQHGCGPQSVVERFGGPDVHYPPGAFGQSNLEVAGQIIAHVRADIPAGARVLELYAGVGAIGLSVIEKTARLSLNEMAAASCQGLELGAAALDEPLRARLSLVPGAAGGEGALQAAAGADLIIADPPRKGLEPALLQHLSLNPPERFLYVSCDLASFLKDSAQLLAAGRLRLTALTAFDLLPYTEHVETLARFERR